MSVSADGQKLLDFIRSAKAHNADDQFLAALLRQNGWSDRRIFSAFAAYYQDATGLAVPARGSRSEDARDAFFYLLAFVTLGIWAVAFVWLGNVLIDRAFPSALDFEYAAESFRSGAAGQLASLIVAFPIFIFVSRAIVLETRRRPESLESGVRKWLTYLALVITTLALVGDGVWFLQQFLLGDLTLRFVLKSLVLFLTAGGVLWYYLGTVRASSDTAAARDSIFGWVAAGAVIVAVVLGFTGIGTPRHGRSLQLDEQRVNDLRAIAGGIAETYRAAHRLPKVLPPIESSKLDPETLKPYAYVPLGPTRFKLCAVFDASGGGSTDSTFWKHPAGETCFTLDALNYTNWG
ncbi:MAG: DUF5671 domain-containing protein [Candidatus Tumulicola sp.]